MNLKEFQGKILFQKHGIPTPKSVIISSVAEINKAQQFTASVGEVVVKAQILSGKRGKSGGVQFATVADVEKKIKRLLGSRLLGHMVEQVLVAEKVKVLSEYYLSITFDKMNKSLILIFSQEGGVDIEETAETKPEAIIKRHLPLYFQTYHARELVKSFDLDLPPKEQMQMADIIYKLFLCLRAEDASLVEVNPLMRTDKGIIAADSKVVLDDNALYRHPEHVQSIGQDLSDVERKARVYDLQYVELDGNIGVIGNGAGLVMTTLDILNHFGGTAANFLDIGGGASVEKMEQSMEVILMKPGLKSIFINIFGGITRCDEIAQGLANFKKSHDIAIPIVVRMVGTNEAKGIEILKQSHMEAISDMEQAAQKAIQLAS
jgi:succinyl-CoA synthetase beta subunit